MHRRNFLLFTAALTAACVRDPREVDVREMRGSSQPQALSRIDPHEPLLTSLARAKRRGKPLLVLVVPKYSGQASLRGRVLGTMLNKGDEQVLETLALCEVACATIADVRKSIAIPVGEPWMLLVETSHSTPYALALDGKLPPAPKSKGRRDEESSNEAARQALEFTSNLLLKGVALNQATLRRRAAESRAALGDPKLGLLLTGGTRELDYAFAGALIGLAHDGSIDRDVVRRRLASAAVARVRNVPPPGANWVNSTGCGCRVEGESNRKTGYISCGMGFVPEVERRFLRFFS